MTREMNARQRLSGTWGKTRYKRFAALDDALLIYFIIAEADGFWLSTVDIRDKMEWSADNATNRRLRRICESLQRIGRIEIHYGHRSIYGQNMYRVPKGERVHDYRIS